MFYGGLTYNAPAPWANTIGYRHEEKDRTTRGYYILHCSIDQVLLGIGYGNLQSLYGRFSDTHLRPEPFCIQIREYLNAGQKNNNHCGGLLTGFTSD